jgi:hypothetical protein
MSLQDEDSASTSTRSERRKDLSQSQSQNERILSQEELKAWWPFTRLDPKRFPKSKQPEYEDALL